ncbi:MAG: hypothetical protein QM811_30155 [Pirellulales bacterium]
MIVAEFSGSLNGHVFAMGGFLVPFDVSLDRVAVGVEASLTPHPEMRKAVISIQGVRHSMSHTPVRNEAAMNCRHCADGLSIFQNLNAGRSQSGNVLSFGRVAVLRPLPAIAAADIVSVETHPAQIDRHRFVLEGEADVAAIDPPRERGQQIVNRPVALVLQHVGEEHPLIRGKGRDELVEPPMVGRFREDAFIAHLETCAAQTSFVHELIDDCLVSVDQTGGFFVMRHHGSAFSGRPGAEPRWSF